MGRPTASEQNKQFGAFFASIVTVRVECENTTIQRCGEGGLFYVFAQCFPECIRTNSRNGLTQLEFNKYLQTRAFPRVRKRHRRKLGAPERRQLAFFPPSSFRFAGRKWRDPDDEEDKSYLHTAWPVLVNGMTRPISFEGFLDELRFAIALDNDCVLEPESGPEDGSACETPPKDGVAGSEENNVLTSDEKDVAMKMEVDEDLLEMRWHEQHKTSAEHSAAQPAQAPQAVTEATESIAAPAEPKPIAPPEPEPAEAAPAAIEEQPSSAQVDTAAEVKLEEATTNAPQHDSATVDFDAIANHDAEAPAVPTAEVALPAKVEEDETESRTLAEETPPATCLAATATATEVSADTTQRKRRLSAILSLTPPKHKEGMDGTVIPHIEDIRSGFVLEPPCKASCFGRTSSFGGRPSSFGTDGFHPIDSVPSVDFAFGDSLSFTRAGSASAEWLTAVLSTPMPGWGDMNQA